MKHVSPKAAMRMYQTQINLHLQSFAAKSRRIISAPALLALILLLVIWSNFASSSGSRDAHADVLPPRGTQHLQLDNRVSALQSSKIVTLDPFDSTCVEENSNLRIIVRINEPLSSAEADELEGRQIVGGVIIFDPADAPFASSLSAFVFREGQKTASAAGYTVRSGEGKLVPRTIRVAVNSVFPDYSVGSPSERTIQVRESCDRSPPRLRQRLPLCHLHLHLHLLQHQQRQRPQQRL